MASTWNKIIECLHKSDHLSSEEQNQLMFVLLQPQAFGLQRPANGCLQEINESDSDDGNDSTMSQQQTAPEAGVLSYALQVSAHVASVTTNRPSLVPKPTDNSVRSRRAFMPLTICAMGPSCQPSSMLVQQRAQHPVYSQPGTRTWPLQCCVTGCCGWHMPLGCCNRRRIRMAAW